jgi:hypothetical protein
MPCWHKWGKWELREGTEYRRNGTSVPTTLQIRTCKRCGKNKLRRIVS